MKRIVKIIVCPNCHGEGSETVPFGNGNHFERKIVTCGQCQGTGLVEREILITEKPYIPYERFSKSQR